MFDSLFIKLFFLTAQNADSVMDLEELSDSADEQSAKVSVIVACFVINRDPLDPQAWVVSQLT